MLLNTQILESILFSMESFFLFFRRKQMYQNMQNDSCGALSIFGRTLNDL